MAIPDGTDVRHVETPHGRVRLRDAGGHPAPNGGAGPDLPILLVHSLAVDPDLYAAVVPLLTAGGHRVIVPELPLGAHGLPAADGADLTPPGLARLLVEVLDALGVDRAHVVGVDTGGALTQILMAEHRERVGLVVLTACDAYDAFPPRSFGWLLRPLRSRAVLAMMAQGARFGPLQRLAVPRPVTHRGVDPATLRRWTAPLRNPAVRRDLRAVLTAMHPRHTLAAAERNRDFPRPVLIAWGDDDRAFPRRLAERLAADLPHARRVTIEDCAAFAAIDQPERLAALVEEHLTRHADDGRAPAQTTAPSSGPS